MDAATGVALLLGFMLCGAGAYLGAREAVASLRAERKQHARGVEYDLLNQRITNHARLCSPQYEPTDLADAVDWLIEEHNRQRAFSEELFDDLRGRRLALAECDRDRQALAKERDFAVEFAREHEARQKAMSEELAEARAARNHVARHAADLETRIKNAKLKLDSPTEVVDLPTAWVVPDPPRPTILPIIREAD